MDQENTPQLKQASADLRWKTNIGARGLHLSSETTVWIDVKLHTRREMCGIHCVVYIELLECLYCKPDIPGPANVCCSFCLSAAVVKPSGHHLKLALKMNNFAKAMFKPMRWGLNLHLMSTWSSSNTINSFFMSVLQRQVLQSILNNDCMSVNTTCHKRLRNILSQYIIK